MPSDTAWAMPAIAPKSLAYGAGQKMRVITALVMRERITAFGNRKLGYLWALLEPIAYIGLFVAMHSYVKDRIPYGESATIFIFTGVMAFRIFIGIAGRTLNAVTANQALLTYPQVRPLDTIFARIILQSLTMIFVMIVFYGLLANVQDRPILVRPVTLTLGLCITLYLGASVGALNAVLVAIMPSWASVWGILSFPLFLLSGLFYLPASLPPAAQYYLSWNPVLHCVELIRSASYLNYLTILDISYPIAFATLTLVLALFLERAYRNVLLSGV